MAGADQSYATRPGGIAASPARVRALEPWILNRNTRDAAQMRAQIPLHLAGGSLEPAIVVATGPLVVAAYTEDIDCVVLLSFKDEALPRAFAVGERLASVNQHLEGGVANDCVPGDRASGGPWVSCIPYIVQLLSDDVRACARRVHWIQPHEWSRLDEAVQRYTTQFGHRARNGVPSRAHVPAF